MEALSAHHLPSHHVPVGLPQQPQASAGGTAILHHTAWLPDTALHCPMWWFGLNLCQQKLMHNTASFAAEAGPTVNLTTSLSPPKSGGVPCEGAVRWAWRCLEMREAMPQPLSALRAENEGDSMLPL